MNKEIDPAKRVKCRNGDALASVEARMSEVREQIKIVSLEIEADELRLKPKRELLAEYLARLQNLHCRKATWLTELGHTLEENQPL